MSTIATVSALAILAAGAVRLVLYRGWTRTGTYRSHPEGHRALMDALRRLHAEEERSARAQSALAAKNTTLDTLFLAAARHRTAAAASAAEEAGDAAESLAAARSELRRLDGVVEQNMGAAGAPPGPDSPAAPGASGDARRIAVGSALLVLLAVLLIAVGV
ncbi:hypothetical protein [Marinitenerispora sediminis]|uniref:Chemotaxis protein n=1 Tax=Marinitenerispora sediminis TaxID=1931232 RepID=A0A368T7W2_9ACTN|nr:hypothetical protein [Marinitenerispora sediminis]RCV51362.1 hypothetical protein DEF28_15675 [Marinitenerispora sediminis]RCV57190.1 hypothetical protein DEF23_11250 [Marinitenerispora sediminis]RCV60303.1 hypothetical protein DEF24_07450 [Marinitenerispora sediminis]